MLGHAADVGEQSRFQDDVMGLEVFLSSIAECHDLNDRSIE